MLPYAKWSCTLLFFVLKMNDNVLSPDFILRAIANSKPHTFWIPYKKYSRITTRAGVSDFSSPLLPPQPNSASFKIAPSELYTEENFPEICLSTKIAVTLIYSH